MPPTDKLSSMSTDVNPDALKDEAASATSNHESPEFDATSTIGRTKTAIIQAALEILPSNATASLNDIAEHAGVGRSTLHRHFADREEILFTLARHIRKLALEAIDRAAPSFGSPEAALRRTVNELIDLGPALVWMNETMRPYRDEKLSAELSDGLEGFRELIGRAQQPGTELPVQWRSRVFWEVLRLGPEYIDKYPRQQVIEYIMTTLTNGIAQSDSA